MSRELRRVPLDFNWPLNKVWGGYVSPAHFEEAPCPANCENGYSPRAAELHALWYGNRSFHPSDTGCEPLTEDSPVVRARAERNVAQAPDYYGTGEMAVRREARRLRDHFNGAWQHHLTQEDVDTLVAAGRLMDFTHTWSKGTGWQPRNPPYVPTAPEVNFWSLDGMGHDSSNCWIVVKAYCDKEGVSDTCSACDGHGSVEAYPGQRAEAEAWQWVEPPEGPGYQAWETTSEGSPISPVFATPEELVEWAIQPDSNLGFGGTPISREAAEAFVKRGSSIASMVAIGGELMDGVTALTKMKEN